MLSAPLHHFKGGEIEAAGIKSVAFGLCVLNRALLLGCGHGRKDQGHLVW